MVRISPSLVLVDMVIDGRFAGNDGRVTQYFQASGDERWILAECFMVRSPVDEPIPIPNTIGAGTARRRQRMGERGPSLLWADICPANARQQSDRAGGADGCVL